MNFSEYRQYYRDNGFLPNVVTWSRLPEYIRGIITGESFIENVELQGNNLVFSGIGDAFNSSIDLSSLVGVGVFPGFTDLPTDYGVTLSTVAISNDYNDLDNLPTTSSSSFDPSQDIDFTGEIYITPPFGDNNINFLEGYISINGKGVDRNYDTTIDSDSYNIRNKLDNSSIEIKPNPNMTGNWDLFLPEMVADDTLALKSEIDALTTSKYSETFGDGSTLDYTINYSLNSEDIQVRVVDVNTKERFYPTEIGVDANNLRLVFTTAPTTNQYRVTITA